MNSNERSELIAALKKGTVTVTFQKVSSEEIRVMPCTLNPAVLHAYEIDYSVINMHNERIINKQTDQFPVWSTDQNAWRSFRVDTVLSWEVLGE
jgi:hypothetical protein